MLVAARTETLLQTFFLLLVLVPWKGMFKTKYVLKMQKLSMTIVIKKALVTFHLDRFAINVGISALFFSSYLKTLKGFIKKLTEWVLILDQNVSKLMFFFCSHNENVGKLNCFFFLALQTSVSVWEWHEIKVPWSFLIFSQLHKRHFFYMAWYHHLQT